MLRLFREIRRHLFEKMTVLKQMTRHFRGRWYIFKHFSDNTSIHGLKLITQNDVSIVERLAWSVVFLAGVAFSTYFCVQMWKKYEDSPVLVSLDTTRYLLENTSFPAVTVCNVNKVSKKRLAEVLSEERALRYITRLDRAKMATNDLKELALYYKTLNISATELFKILNRTAPTCEDLVLDCTWQGVPYKCDDFIDRFPTDDGLCCVFNSAFYNDTELEFLSKKDELLQVQGHGYRMGVTMVLNADVEDYSVTNGNFDGFKVLVHGPEEFPDVADRGFVLNPGSETFVGVRGISAFIADEVATVIPQRKRRCLVDGEAALNHFLRYSQSACVIDCATRQMQDICKCRPYFLRAEPDTPLCELDQYPCISAVYEDIRRHGVEKCECLPQCTDEWYVPEITSANFPGRGFNMSKTYLRSLDKLNLTPDSDTMAFFKSNVAVLHVYYKDRTGFRYKSDIRFGIEDFISAMGGLLSLGFGVSFISFIELGNFICVRLFCHKHNHLKKNDGAAASAEQLPRRRFSVPGFRSYGAADKQSFSSMASADQSTDVSIVSLSSREREL